MIVIPFVSMASISTGIINSYIKKWKSPEWMIGALVTEKTDLNPTPNLPILFTSSFLVVEPIVVIASTSFISNNLAPLWVITNLSFSKLKFTSDAYASSAFCKIS